MNKTSIEYLTHTWNPLAMRCDPVSEGCAHCWHIKMSNRMAGMAWPDNRRLIYRGASLPKLIQKELEAPAKLKKPARIGVQFMGDICHEDIYPYDIVKIWSVMSNCLWHTFLILTKRPERLAEMINEYFSGEALPNVWLGVSAENQARANERVPMLLQTPAEVRFVSVEPMLSTVEIGYNVDWIICGAETGPGKRPMGLAWAYKLRDAATEQGIPFFFKQDSNGFHDLSGQVWEQYPKGAE